MSVRRGSHRWRVSHGGRSWWAQHGRRDRLSSSVVSNSRTRRRRCGRKRWSSSRCGGQRDGRSSCLTSVLAADGRLHLGCRLVLLDPSGKPGGPVRAEAALLHLNTFKGKNTKIMFSSKATQPEQIDAPRGFLMPLFGDQQWRPLTGDEIAQLRRRAPVNDTGAYVPASARR